MHGQPANNGAALPAETVIEASGRYSAFEGSLIETAYSNSAGNSKGFYQHNQVIDLDGEDKISKLNSNGRGIAFDKSNQTTHKDKVIEERRNEYFKLGQVGSPTTESLFTSELPGQLTEMSKVTYQGHNSSVIEAHQANLPRGNKNTSGMANIAFNADAIFDESFDLEEFMFGQNGFQAVAGNFASPTQSDDSSSCNIMLNLNCNGQRSFSQSSTELLYDSNHAVAGNKSENSNQESKNFCSSDGQIFQGPTINSAGKNITNIGGQPEANIDLNLCQGTFFQENAFRGSGSHETPEAGDVINRKRDYSLSNDSGVEECTFMDSNFLFTKTQQSSSENSVSSASQLPSFQFSDRDVVAMAPVSRQPLNGQMYEENFPGCLNANSNTNNNNRSGAAEADDVRYPSNDSDSRTESHDTDAGDESDIFGGGKANSSMQFCSAQLSIDSKNASKKTAYNEKWGVKVLKAWCVENRVSTDFEKLSADELNSLLTRFWAEVRKSNGDYYGRNSLFNLRAMINKHLKGKPYCVTFDIVTDERFRTSNERLEKQLKILKGIGRTITHKQPISISDLRKMYDSSVLGTSNPLALLRKVWFEITLHFCHKGSESQEKLKKSSFDIYRDQNGRRYVARTNASQTEGDEIRMYETGGDLCPVRSYEYYTRKLHALQPRLFQQPRRKSTPDSPMWYGKAPIGEKALQQMMANISTAAKLSKRYTNHCVRTTALEQFSNSRRKSWATPCGEKPLHCSNATETNNENRMDQNYKPLAGSQMPQQYNNMAVYSDLHPDSLQQDPSCHVRPSVSATGSYYAQHPVDTSLLLHGNGGNNMVQYNGSDQYARHMETISQHHSAHVRSGKRGYPADLPMYPPPPYNEHHFQTSVSPPTKRMRSDEAGEPGGFQRAIHELQPGQIEHFQDYENQHSRQNVHRFFGGSFDNKRRFDSSQIRKSYSDDSGTGRSLLSPISVNTLPGDHDHEHDLYSGLTGSAGHLSETIVAGSTYDMVGNELSFGKRIQPAV